MHIYIYIYIYIIYVIYIHLFHLFKYNVHTYPQKIKCFKTHQHYDHK